MVQVVALWLKIKYGRISLVSTIFNIVLCGINNINVFLIAVTALAEQTFLQFEEFLLPVSVLLCGNKSQIKRKGE